MICVVCGVSCDVFLCDMCRSHGFMEKSEWEYLKKIPMLRPEAHDNTI